MTTSLKANASFKSVRVKGPGRSTGPQSAQGKAKSSQNAVSHGLTSNRVMPDEICMVEEFTQELTEYYKPESPLEVLQIQRIAFCRAKLAKLIDIEVAGREIARRQIDLDPERVMQRLTQYPEKLRNLALASIGGESVLSELGLDESTWILIVQEIRGFVGVLEAEADLIVNFPKLCTFLLETNSVRDQIDDAGVDQLLMLFVQRIRNLAWNAAPNVHVKTQKSSQDGKFEDFLAEVHRSHQIDNMAARKTLRVKMPGVAGYHQAVDLDFQEIMALASLLNKVPLVVQSFQEMKSWMLRAADLQSDETDRMMKYQTMLERRLSSAIGELLELFKRRVN